MATGNRIARAWRIIAHYEYTPSSDCYILDDGVNLRVISKTSDTEYAVSVTLPHGTDVTKLVPGIATYGNVTVSPGSGEAQDFSSPVTYTVTLEDGTVLHYVVTVSVSAGSKADQFWDELAETGAQDPWWEYAKEQQEKGKYPKYW